LAFIQDQWQQVRLKDREIESARIELAMLEAMVEFHRQAFQLSSQNSRKADERLESSSNPDSERNRWLKAFNDICKQQQEARLASLATEREARQENLSYLLEQRVLLQRKDRLSSRTSPLLLAEKTYKSINWKSRDKSWMIKPPKRLSSTKKLSSVSSRCVSNCFLLRNTWQVTCPTGSTVLARVRCSRRWIPP
jgi:hypothetical protein